MNHDYGFIIRQAVQNQQNIGLWEKGIEELVVSRGFNGHQWDFSGDTSNSLLETLE